MSRIEGSIYPFNHPVPHFFTFISLLVMMCFSPVARGEIVNDHNDKSTPRRGLILARALGTVSGGLPAPGAGNPPMAFPIPPSRLRHTRSLGHESLHALQKTGQGADPAPPPSQLAMIPKRRPRVHQQPNAKTVEQAVWRRTADRSDSAPLWRSVDAGLQTRLQRTVQRLGLGKALAKRKLTVALVDISQPDHPRVAALNGNRMMYAASLPKIAILLAVFEKIAAGEMVLDRQTEGQLRRMIRRSSNADSTTLMRRVGKAYIAKVLRSDRYRLYDPRHNGGLWAGKDYGSAGTWRRDPLHNLSHGATAMQVARFYYLLDRGLLVNRRASRKMKEILGDSAITHKFKLGLQQARPGAKLYRKSGSWGKYHSDSAIVERPGARYIAVALSEDSRGRKWLVDLIVAMDRLVDEDRPTLVRADSSLCASVTRCGSG